MGDTPGSVMTMTMLFSFSVGTLALHQLLKTFLVWLILREQHLTDQENQQLVQCKRPHQERKQHRYLLSSLVLIGTQGIWKNNNKTCQEVHQANRPRKKNKATDILYKNKKTSHLLHKNSPDIKREAMQKGKETVKSYLQSTSAWHLQSSLNDWHCTQLQEPWNVTCDKNSASTTPKKS